MEYSGEKLDDILGFGSWKNSSGWGVKSVANSVACQEGIRERFFFFCNLFSLNRERRRVRYFFDDGVLETEHRSCEYNI